MQEIKQEKVTALYARFSKEEDAESNSIKSQKEILARYAEEHGLINYKVYADDGFTGTNFERPDFKRMIEDIEDGCIGTVVVKDSSRLGRNYLGCGMYTEMVFAEYGIRFISINDNVDTFKGEDDFAPFRNIMNEWYSRDISKKQRAALQNKGRSGKRLTVRAIYGYKNNADGNWIIDEPAAETVRLIFKLCLEGKGVHQIANILHDKNIKIPVAYSGKGRLSERTKKDPCIWSAQTVSKILAHQEYCGDTVNFRTSKPSYKNKKFIYNDKSAHMIFPNTHEAIITREDFAEVQKIRAEKRRYFPAKDRALFSGIAYCYDCKNRMYSHRTNNDDRPDCYICSKYRRFPKECTSHYVRNDYLEKFVLTAINELIRQNIDNHVELISKLKKCLNSESHKEKEKNQKNISDYTVRISDIDNIIKQLYEDKLNGEISKEVFLRLAAQYTAEQHELNDKIFALSKKIGSIKKQETEVNQFLAAINKYDELFTELTPDIIKEFIEKVEVHSKEIINGEPYRKIDIFFRGIGYINMDEFLDVLP